MRTNRDFIDRVDDSMLVQVSQLARLRSMTVRGALEDFRQTAVENVELSRGTDDQDIWELRVERCNIILADPDDSALRRRVGEAIEADR